MRINNNSSEDLKLGSKCRTILPDVMTKSLEKKANRSVLLSARFRNISHVRTHRGIVSSGTDPSSFPTSCLLPCSAGLDDFRDKLLLLQQQSSKVETATPSIQWCMQTTLQERVVPPQPNIQRELWNPQRGTRSLKVSIPGQAVVFDLCTNELVDGGASPPPHVLLVHRQEGSDETETLMRQCNVASFMGRRVLKVSFRGNTVTVFDKQNATGFTFMLRDMNDSVRSEALDENMKTKLRKLLSSASVVVVDQVSSQNPSRLVQLSDACKLSTGKHDPFGGLYVVLVGDFCQLSPVRGRAPLPNSAVNSTAPRLPQPTDPEPEPPVPMDIQSRGRSKLSKEIQTKLNSENLHVRRADLLHNACSVKITRQMRVRDPAQTALVETVYNRGAARISDLEQYLVLSTKDFTGRNGDWSNAPIIVPTHRERLSLAHDQAINFALANNTVVIRWEMEIKKWEQRPPEEFTLQAKSDPCFYQYFVSGAPAYLNSTINKELCLIDSTPVTLESFTMKDEISQRSALELIAAANPGSVITLEDVPAFVNVRVETKKFSVAVKKTYKEHF